MENEKDKELWKKAEARASFKKHLFSYVAVNLFLVAIWLTSSRSGANYFWPVWQMLGWGIGVLIHYFSAFHADVIFSVENEYQKLKDKS